VQMCAHVHPYVCVQEFVHACIYIYIYVCVCVCVCDAVYTLLLINSESNQMI
jgi:hypothetical protein